MNKKTKLPHSPRPRMDGRSFVRVNVEECEDVHWMVCCRHCLLRSILSKICVDEKRQMDDECCFAVFYLLIGLRAKRRHVMTLHIFVAHIDAEKYAVEIKQTSHSFE